MCTKFHNIATLALAFALTLTWVAMPSWSQEVRATVGGRVTDPAGAVIPGAEVAVISEQTGVRQTTQSNAEGNWVVQFLIPGRYRLTVAAPGFKTTDFSSVELLSGDIKQIDAQLQVGQALQSVEVTAEAPLIDTTAATSGSVISEKQLREMPTASHVPTLLATLSPGVIAQDQNNNVAHLWSNDAASQMTANGGRNNTYSNNFQLDGMPNTKSGGQVAFIPPMDSLQEFKVQTNAYDASIGRQAGATINMQTKSGSKDFHGSLYEYNQNSLLNANLLQTNLIGGAVPQVHVNEFGGTLGGPVWLPKVYDGREKTFFFVSFDKTLNSNPLGAGLRSLPTDLERAGDFSQSWTTQTVNGQRVRYPIQIFDPNTVDAKGNRTLFPGNKIPQSRLDPVAQALLGYVPLPNTPSDGTSNTSNNYVTQATRHDTFPVISIRADQNWNNWHRSFVTVRWNRMTEDSQNFFGAGNPATGVPQRRTAGSIGLDHTWTVSPSMILDIRYTLNRFEKFAGASGSGFNPTQLGMPSSFTSQLKNPSFPYIKDFAGDFGAQQVNNSVFNTYHTWAGTLTQVKGNHTLHYGAEYWIQQEADVNVGNQGEFDFNSNWTRQNALTGGGVGVGSTTASFVLGLPSGGNVPNNADGFYSQRFAGFFAQDDWRLTRRLTVNAGLRWDLEQPPTERYNRLVDRYDFNATSPISGAAQSAYASILGNAANASNPGVQLLKQLLPASAFQVTGALQFAGVNGVPRSAINPSYTQWQPRLGFAYQIGTNTVVRGGVGRFVQASYVIGGQQGYSTTTSLIATRDSFFTPYDTLSNPFRNGIQTPTGSSLGALTNLGAGISSWDDPNLGRQYSWEYSLHLQHQWRGWLLEAGYSHNKTSNIAVGWNQNLPSFSLWQQYLAPQFDATGRPLDILVWNQQVPNPFYGLPGVTGGTIGTSKTVAMNQLLNQTPLLGGINQNRGTGKNQYDAMLSKIERRFSNGFSMIVAFTWSKLFEDTSFLGNQIAGARIEHKLGGEDRPYHLSIAPIWELPFGRGRRFGGSSSRWMDALIGGWQLAGNYNFQSGVPVVFSNDINAFFSGNNLSLGDRKSMTQWFDTSQFVAFPSKTTDISNYPAWTGVQNLPGYSYKPAAGDTIKNGVYQDFANFVRTYPTRWGNVRADGVNEANIGLYKSITMTERMRMQLRFSAFNAFNHPRLPAPNSDPNSSAFGRVTPTQQNQARSVELGAKLYF